MANFTRHLHSALFGRWDVGAVQNLVHGYSIDDGYLLDDGWYLDGWYLPPGIWLDSGWYLDGWYLTPGQWSYGTPGDLDDGLVLDDGWYLDGCTFSSIAGVGWSWAAFLAGTLTPAGTLAAGVHRALSGTLTPAGALAANIRASLVGVLTALGNLTWGWSVNLAGTLTPAGALSSRTHVSLAGTLTAGGILGGVAVLAGITTAIGALRRAIQGRSPFRIDVLNSSGTVIGSGPLATVMRLNDTNSLDRIGSASFTLPATDPMCSLIEPGCQFDAWDKTDYIGRFIYQSRRLSDSWGEPVLEVSCQNALQLLSRYTVGFRRVYAAQAVDVVIADLVALATGWSATVDAGIGDTTIPYEGESVLMAVDALRDRWGKHYRLSPPYTLEFGAFGVDSGVRLTNLRGQITAELWPHEEIAIVDSISLVEEDAEVFNRIIPLGAGQGVSQLTIELATQGAYTVQSAVNQDASLYYYIEDATSVSLYGRRTRVLSFPNIRQLANTDPSRVNAANMLKLTAEAYLARHTAPKVTYSVSVRALRASVSPGDLVRLVYHGRVDGYDYLNVDQYFYVTDIDRQREITGNRSTSLTISTAADRRTADTDVLIDVINDVRALKVHVPITLAYSPVGPYIKRIDSTHTASFTIRLGSEVTALNYAKMRFKTSPLRSSITTLAAAQSSVETTTSVAHDHDIGDSGSHLHSVTIGSGGSHVHSTNITAGGSHVHSTNITAGGSHLHSVTIGAGGSHLHNVTIGEGGAHEHIITDRTSNQIGATYDPHYHDFLSFTQEAEHSHAAQETVAATHSHSATDSAAAAHTHGAIESAAAAHTHGVIASAAASHSHAATASTEATHTHTITATGAHAHSLTIPAHSHAISYGLYEDTVYPRVISITVDGAAVPGGTWAPANASVEHEIDITSLLLAGTLRQNHAVVFSCTTGQGEIEFECDLLCSIQPVQV